MEAREARRGWIASVLGALLLILFSLLLTALLAEGLVRLLAPQQTEPHPRGLYASDAELGFVLAPGVVGASRGLEWDVGIRTNALALRDRELPAAKLTGERRILVLGDSFTFGIGVGDDETYPRRTDAALRKNGAATTRVLNAGVPGYGTRQQAAWLARILDRVQPDAVLVGFFINDFYDNLELNAFDVVDGYLVTRVAHGSRKQLLERLGIPPSVKIALRTNSHLYNLLMNRWSALLTRFGWAETRDVYAIYREQPSPDTQRAIEETRRALGQLAAFCRERGLPLGIVFISDGRVAPQIGELPGHDFTRPARIVAQLAEALGLPLLDLSESFRDRGDLYFPVDGHWNAAGHAVAAEAIAASLTSGELRVLRTR